MAVINFIWYCLKCMFRLFPVLIGHVNGLTWKDGLVGVATLLVIAGTIIVILYFTGVIRFGRK